MSSHFANEKYYLMNQEISQRYFGDSYKARYYQNASLALFDVAAGLQHFLAHKAHFAVAKEGSSLIEGLSPVWTRNVNPLQTKADSQNWAEFTESLHAETNFVLWASENEITGEVLVTDEVAQEIHQRLSHKRIFSIQICHHLNPEEKIFPYAIKILRPSIFKDTSAMVVHADKFRAHSQMGSFQNLQFSYSELDQFFVNTINLNLSEIKKFEQQVANPKNVYFNRFVDTTQRLNDRLVFNYSQLNGYAVQQELGLADQDCLSPSRYPFWILQTWKTWWKEAEDQVLLRGLLAVSIRALQQDPSLISKINTVVDEFQRLGHLNKI